MPPAGDWIFPMDRSAQPLFEAFGTPGADKQFVEVEGSHGRGAGFENARQTASQFFDRQFGPVRQ